VPQNQSARITALAFCRLSGVMYVRHARPEHKNQSCTLVEQVSRVQDFHAGSSPASNGTHRPDKTHICTILACNGKGPMKEPAQPSSTVVVFNRTPAKCGRAPTLSRGCTRKLAAALPADRGQAGHAKRVPAPTLGRGRTRNLAAVLQVDRGQAGHVRQRRQARVRQRVAPLQPWVHPEGTGATDAMAGWSSSAG